MNSVKFFGVFIAVCVLVSCGGKSSMPVPSFGDQPIALSARVDNVIGRAAVSEFPNAVNNMAQVSIVACKSVSMNWSDLTINHAVANVGAASSGYSLSWAEGHTQYWPANGDELVFMAYSPITMGGSGTTLDVSLSETTPDVVFADTKDGANPIIGSKPASAQTPQSVNFLFTHILSQLQVKIKNPAGQVKITRVEVVVASAHCSKKYNMPYRSWTAGTSPADDMSYSSATNWSGFGSSVAEEVFSAPLLLFPNTQAHVTINVYTGVNVFASKKVNEFFDQGNVAASFVAGKKTILTLTVAGDDLGGLTAGVQEWEELGDYGTIVR